MELDAGQSGRNLLDNSNGDSSGRAAMIRCGQWMHTHTHTLTQNGTDDTPFGWTGGEVVPEHWQHSGLL